MFWSCPKLSDFWLLFLNIISNISNLKICKSPRIAIFCCLPDDIATTSTQFKVLSFTPLIARREILFLWKSSQPLSTNTWLLNILFLLKLEKMKFTLRGHTNKFYTHWSPLLDYMDGLPCAEVAS